MLNRCGQAVVVAVLALVMLGADDSSARFNRLGHKMICACSCGQVLVECNHVGCPDSEAMIGELRGRIADGSSDSSILSWFAGKYGAMVLAAPIRGGFDDVAWIAPFTVFILATFGTAVLVKVWKRRTDRLVLAEARSASLETGWVEVAGHPRPDPYGDGALMGLIAACVLTLFLFVYIFWPERRAVRQAEKTRVDYLEERKEVIYENLRELRFEFMAGKHPEQDYEVQRSGS